MRKGVTSGSEILSACSLKYETEKLVPNPVGS